MNRRSFLTAVLATCAAPAIVRASSLMPARGIVVPTTAEVLAINAGGTYADYLTPDWIIREALHLLRQKNVMLAALDAKYRAHASLAFRKLEA